MACRLCNGSGRILRDGRFIECQPCKLRRSNVPKILGMGNLTQNQNKVVENSYFAVEKLSEDETRDLKMMIVEKLLFLRNEGELSWRDIGRKVGKDHTSVMRWARGDDLANNPRILMEHAKKLREVCVNGS